MESVGYIALLSLLACDLSASAWVLQRAVTCCDYPRSILLIELIYIYIHSNEEETVNGTILYCELCTLSS